MFIDQQPKDRVEYYKEMLQSLGSLSRLFSESINPYLYYRAAENLFCKSFHAENLSRGDTSADASKGLVGIGIKTFLYKNGKSLEKIAEFNSKHDKFSALDPYEKVKKISELRNARLESTMRIHNLQELIYHCIVRKSGSIVVHEESMKKIDTDNIQLVVEKNNAITFTDGQEDYSFYIPKSTLFKHFSITNVLLEVPVTIHEEPFELLRAITPGMEKDAINPEFTEVGTIFLPLYGIEKGRRKVFEKSGLNLWNAGGRERNPNEVYIPIPIWIHHVFPGFFPAKDTTFELALPNGKIISAKVCQENSKALMSNPNSDLGIWLLRDILKLKENELATYQHLEKIGLDTVEVSKMGNNTFRIDFKALDTYDNFAQEYDE